MIIRRRPVRQKFVGRLAVDTELGAFLGDARIRLLEAIDHYGSISQAAKVIRLSYKAAWDAVDAMNNVAAQALLHRSAGGRYGGGTRLTDYGRRLVAMYRAVELESQQLVERVAEGLGDAGATEVRHFQTLLRRSSLRTSARNHFAGPVTGLHEGEVSFEVNLRLDAENELSAMISREGAENLGLAIGREVLARVNASSVILMTDPTIRTTARNRLWGEVSRIDIGPVNSDVTITLPGGRTVSALITRESVANLDLTVGKMACALFKAPSVILAAFD